MPNDHAHTSDVLIKKIPSTVPAVGIFIVRKVFEPVDKLLSTAKIGHFANQILSNQYYNSF